MSLVEVACEEAERQGNVRVECLRLQVGLLSGVVKDALISAFELAAEGTAVQGARLMVEVVPIAVLCPSCGEERAIQSIQHFRCVVCDTLATDVVRGRDLQLVSLEVRDVGTEDR